uniref:Uncharacterized protein n=1 Tax=Rhizophora mucronata TaxID=61149 RepID=A0A2P2MT17_RHIMU
MEIEAISAKSTAGETKLEALEKPCESVSKENPEDEEIRKNMEQKSEEVIEEEGGDSKNAGLNDDAIQHIIVEKHTGTEASPQYSREETAASYKDEAEAEAKTRKEVQEEPEKNIVGKSTEKQALEEANRVINQSTEQSGEAVAEDDAKIADKNGDDGSQSKEGCAMKDNFEVPVKDMNKEGAQQKEDESDTMKMKEDVEHLNSGSIEQLEATGSVEAIESETLKDKVEPDNVPYPAAEIQALVHESNEGGVGISSSETRTGEEVTVKEESSVNDSISVSITTLATETIVREPEDLDSLMKGTIDVEGTQDKVLIDAKPEDASKLVEKVDHKIPAAMDKAEEGTKQETKMEPEMQRNENPKEPMTTVTASGDLQEDKLPESSTLPSKEFEFKTSKASEIIDEIPAEDQTAHENAETLRMLWEKELAQNEDDTTNAIEVSGVGSVGSGIETTTTENVQTDEEHVSSPRGGEMPKMEETTDPVDQEETHKLETLDWQHEESPSARDDALKCMESTFEDRKETILGEEGTTKKSEVSLKEAIMTQEAVVGYEAVDHKQELEPTETNKYDTVKGENLELAESGKEQKCASERVTSDQSDAAMPGSISNTVEEIRNVGLDQSSESIAQMSQEFQAEIEKKAEPDLDVEGPTREMQDTEEMIKTAISAEKVRKTHCQVKLNSHECLLDQFFLMYNFLTGEQRSSES